MDHWKKSKEKSKNIWSQMKMKIHHTNSYGMQQSSPKREIHCNTGSPQQTRKISNKQSQITPNWIRKRRTNKTQSQQKERNNKIRAEINEIETEKRTERIDKTRRWVFEKIDKIDKPFGAGPVAEWLSSRAPLQAAQCFVGSNPGHGHGTARQAILRRRPTCHN